MFSFVQHLARGFIPIGFTGTLLPHTSQCVPTVTDNAFEQGLIGAREVGISFAPVANPGDANGELTFGGTDPSKYIGALTYVYVSSVVVRVLALTAVTTRPITTTSPASRYVGFEQTVSYGDADRVILSKSAGITDTGTTLVLLATGASFQYLAPVSIPLIELPLD